MIVISYKTLWTISGFRRNIYIFTRSNGIYDYNNTLRSTMKIITLFAIALLFILPTRVNSQDISQKNLSVTVYNNNLGVVKDVRKMELVKGLSEISITNVAKLIDPTSVHIKFEGEVIEQNYQYDLVSLDKILQKYIDREIRLVSENNELVEGKLLSALGNQVVLEKRDGGLLMIPNLSKYRFSVEALPVDLRFSPRTIRSGLAWEKNGCAGLG